MAEPYFRTEKYQKPDLSTNNQTNVGGAFLSLSLFIILLAFFIILTAASNLDEAKTTDVIDSLEQSFASKNAGDDNYPARATGPVKSTGQGSMFDNIEAMLNARFLGVEKRRSFGKNVAYMQIDKAQFKSFMGMTEAQKIGHAERDAFFHKLQVVLTSVEGETPYQIHLAVSVNEPAATDVDGQTRTKHDAIKELDLIAQKIVEAGFPKERISIGLADKDSDKITLEFRPYRPVYPDRASDVETETAGAS